MKNEITKFKVGETYSVRSIGDHNAVWYYHVTKRTEKSVWIVELSHPANSLLSWSRSDNAKRKKIEIFQDVETCMPEGVYSFAPILKADSPEKETANEPEHGKQYRLTGGAETPCIAKGNSWAESEVKPEPRTTEVTFDMTWSQLIHPMLDALRADARLDQPADAKSQLIQDEFLNLAKIADHAKTLQDENKKLRALLKDIETITAI